MSLASIVIAFGGLGTVVLAGLAVMFWRDPVWGMRLTAHRPEQLPQVMINRYAALTLVALGAVLMADLRFITLMAAAAAVLGLGDAVTYGRAGQPYAKHLIAGLLAAAVAAVGLLAVVTSGEIG
ncbi:MAG: hypothetical protein U1D35_19015 [Paracoccaceae bacterium]|nr:hypothetical protein [Paracoccaceae bacterium]